MPKRKVYHIVPREKGWSMKREGSDRAMKNFTRKKDAMDYARQRAKAEQPSQVKIHKKDGTIQSEHAYGKDPYPPKG